MKLETLIRKLWESNCYDERQAEHDNIDRESYLRDRAEDAYVKWLEFNNPDSIKYKYPNNPNDYEKFMFIEGYLANHRGYRR